MCVGREWSVPCRGAVWCGVERAPGCKRNHGARGKIVLYDILVVVVVVVYSCPAPPRPVPPRCYALLQLVPFHHILLFVSFLDLTFNPNQTCSTISSSLIFTLFYPYCVLSCYPTQPSCILSSNNVSTCQLFPTVPSRKPPFTIIIHVSSPPLRLFTSDYPSSASIAFVRYPV